ncbi:MAG: hypothetical protein WBG68_02100, partial [Poseidonibacter sp.]
INKRLNSGRYASNTKKFALGIIRRFFKYYKRKFKSDILLTFSYPKSLILDFKIELILMKIEETYIAENNVIRLGIKSQYDILQHQVMLLLGFYSGMRKNELRSRFYEDFIIAGWQQNTYRCQQQRLKNTKVKAKNRFFKKKNKI